MTPAQESTPEPTTDSTPEPPLEPAKPAGAGTYSKLDEVLQKVVREWETTELTESQAALLAPSYHQRTVLVGIQVVWPNDPYLPGLATNVTAIDNWMQANGVEVRHADPTERNSRVFGFVPVSKLGALSLLPEVEIVLSQEPYDRSASQRMAAKSAGSEATSAPEFPIWLKGYFHPDVSIVGKIKPPLISIVDRYDAGRLDADARNEPHLWCNFVPDASGSPAGNNVGVEVIFFNDPGAEAVLMTFLDDNGIPRPQPPIGIGPHGKYRTSLGITIHVSKVRSLAALTPVEAIESSQCPDLDWDWDNFGSRPSEEEDTTNAESRSNTDIPAKQGNIVRHTGSIRNEGINLHGADAWDGVSSDYNGNGVKIGILDYGFEGLEDQLSDVALSNKELPPTSRVSTFCYEVINTGFGTTVSSTVDTTDPSTCETGLDHGVATVG